MKPSRILLFAAIVLVQFFLFEAGLRLAAGSEAAPVFQQLFMQDPAIGGHRLRPGASAHFKTADFETDIAINSSGTRGPAKLPSPSRRVKPASWSSGTRSCSRCKWSSDETFCAVLERRLNESRGPGEGHYRVINAGVQGYGPVEELAFFEHVVSGFQPDIVLVAVLRRERRDGSLRRRGRDPAARPGGAVHTVTADAP